MSRKNPNSNRKSGGAGFIITLLILSSLSGFSLGGIITEVFSLTSIIIATVMLLREERKRTEQESDTQTTSKSKEELFSVI